MNSFQQPQCIVLLSRKIEFDKQIIFERFESIIRPPKTEICLLLKRVETSDVLRMAENERLCGVSRPREA